jgi:hypothetical protein
MTVLGCRRVRNRRLYDAIDRWALGATERTRPFYAIAGLRYLTIHVDDVETVIERALAHRPSVLDWRPVCFER